MQSVVKTYNTRSFRSKFLAQDTSVDRLFEDSFQDFFCLKLQQVVPYARLPIPPSREECHTLVFVTRGAYRTKIGFREYTAGPNELVIVPAGSVFSVEHIDKQVAGYTCHFHPNLLASRFGSANTLSEFTFLNVGGNASVAFPPPLLPHITGLFSRLETAYHERQPVSFDIIHAYVLALLTEIKAVEGSRTDQGKNTAWFTTQKLKALAYHHVHDTLTVADFASRLHLSPNHLNRCVRASTGKSASRLIDEVKMIEVKYLLFQTDLSISEVGREVGFLDASYFSRFFKKYEGVTPTTYRKSIDKSL